MLLPIKAICPASKTRRDGTSLIFIQYCKNEDDKTLLNTEIAIPPKYWNKRFRRISDSLPSEYGIAKDLNDKIYQMFDTAQSIVKFALSQKLSDPVGFTKKTFSPIFNLKDLDHLKEQPINDLNLDFFKQIEEYIKSQKKKVSPKMINVYNNLRDTLRAFEDFRKVPIEFEAIDYNFYEEFISYMLNDHILRRRKEIIKGFKMSTAGKNIKQLRIFLRNRMRKKIIPFIDLTDFKTIDEESDAIYLTCDEITGIYDLDLSAKPFLEKYRDLLVVGCLTGLRFSDFSEIKPEDIRNEMLYKKQGKSDHWVVIPLRDQANYILNYKFNKTVPIITNPDFNYYIKEIGKHTGINELIKFSYKRGNKDVIETKPKYAWITSHTCRRSFCTNEFLAGTPVELIMKISGHKSVRDFYKYIRITPEEAAQKIKEIWAQRGQIANFAAFNH